MPRALRKLDVLLMTSDHEGLPMILLEAMALQIPIVSHRIGGIANLLDQGSCGVLVEEHSAPAYAQALYQLTNTPDHRNTIVRNALQRVSTLYSAERNAKAYRNEYSSC